MRPVSPAAIPVGRGIRFDATGRRPVDKWTAAPRPTTSPQGQKPQQKRSTHMVHKPVNSVCYRHTLQKRLPQELRLAGITDMVEANRFLKEVFLPQHNARFATPAEDRGTAFVPFTGALDDILCIHEERTVSNDNTVRYKRLALQIPAGRHRRHYVKARVRVHEYPDGTMAVFHGPRCLARYHADGQPIDSQTREAA